MEARVSTIQDLRAVFKNPAQRCLDEIKYAGFSFVEAKSIFKGLRAAGTLNSLVADGEVIGLIGWAPDEVLGQPIIGTYFMGLESFFQPQIPSVLFGRRFMRKLQAETGNLAMVSMSYSDHPQTERWYRLMGYRLAETFGIQRNFVLDPKV
ncbi:hypothetical protein A6R70_14475 [Agrobacterium rubi]|uniref:hypothetical protein n=1 Tax=Agrobacterium rubi TaxID=28099 RepID=UPI00201B80E2|nr:hypothetical protein [Agrobacterium rubi]MCL6653495.1 hypothetical protein [Agrobacterium rubi]